jgi:hypothetical protein
VGAERHNEGFLHAIGRIRFRRLLAADLYHGKVADNIADAETLSNALDTKQAKAEIADATRFLNERAGQADCGLAVIGFSLTPITRSISRSPIPSTSVPSS